MRLDNKLTQKKFACFTPLCRGSRYSECGISKSWAN